MKNKRNHKTTKNTVTKPPVTKIAKYTLDVNGVFTLVTDITDDKVFDKLYKEWFDHPTTTMWCGLTLAHYIRNAMPNNFCVLEEDYDRITKGKVIHATKEEFESENN